jgi:hypothetical protein
LKGEDFDRAHSATGGTSLSATSTGGNSLCHT